MSREAFPFAAPDVSTLAKALGRELDLVDGRPGHVQLLNMLARSVGCRNFQHFRAVAAAETRIAQPRPSPASTDLALVERVAGHFDSEGQLMRWPSRYQHQMLALWVLWSRFEASSVYCESEINAVIRNNHRFGDHALIRRAMVESKLIFRTSDCREYRRIEQKPTREALALIRLVTNRTSV